MPLSEPVTRQRLHQRHATYEGHARADGLFDIEAHLVDTKDQRYRLMTGVREPGEPIHEMWARLTIDRALNVLDIEVAMDGVPYRGGCDAIEPAYRKLVGTNLGRGFRRALQDALGGVKGCTHVTELLGYLPTAAFQAFAGLTREDDGVTRPFQLDRCHALETSSETVRRYYPAWYRADSDVAAG